MVLATAAPARALSLGAAEDYGWRAKVDALVDGRAISVSVAEGGNRLYDHDGRNERVPASNEKLLLSMALFDALHIEQRMTTTVAAAVTGERVENLWVLGSGDPTLSVDGEFAATLPLRPTKVGALARAIKASGVTRVTGSVIGSTGYFARDWWAPGWKSDFPRRYIPFPTALTFNGNRDGDDHFDDPELRVARALTRRLDAIDISVRGEPQAAPPPDRALLPVASVASPPLWRLVRYTNRSSSNFFAEVLGKRLGVETFGAPGTIAKGAAAIEAWSDQHGVAVEAADASGLSYDNRVSPRGVTRLLEVAELAPWASALRRGLPRGGQGTLEERLRGVRVRAKTGTLERVSALSGWVWLERRNVWAEFSILSRGMDKDDASRIEDQIVRIVSNYAR